MTVSANTVRAFQIGMLFGVALGALAAMAGFALSGYML